VIKKFKNAKLYYRKLKISDYYKFKKLFYLCFNKKISYDFFKWRYFSNMPSFCYGAFESSKLIANVGMVSMKLNTNTYERTFSRHSSMVLKKYRGYGVFSNLLKRVKKKISKKVRIVIMWPNKNNFSNFSIDEKNILKKKYFLYNVSSKSKLVLKKKTENFNIDKLIKFKDFIKNNSSFFYKNLNYFKYRYLKYKKNNYLINRFKSKTFSSFLILKRNIDKFGSNYVILDHFGDEKLKSKHITNLINDQKRLTFLSKKKINKNNFNLLNIIYFKIGFIKNLKLKQKKNFLINKEIYLGDTDIFIKIGNN